MTHSLTATVRAPADTDLLVFVDTGHGIAPADLRAIEQAAAQVGAIDRRQAQLIDALQSRLGG